MASAEREGPADDDDVELAFTLYLEESRRSV
jgi:hypothetical protein